MQEILENPLWIGLALSALLVLPTVPFRWGLLACFAAFFWADSSMRGGYEIRVARFGLLLAVLLQGALRLGRIGRGEPVPMAARLLFAWMVLSIAWSADRGYSILSCGAFLAVGILAFRLVPQLVATPAHAERLLRGVLFLFLALLVLGFVPPLHPEEWFTADRLRGFFANANGLGLSAALLAPWPLVLLRTENGRPRALAFGIVFLLASLAFLSGSRTGFGGLLVAVGATLFLRHPSRLLLGLAILGVLVTLATFIGGDVDLEQGASSHLARLDTISRISGRLERWRSGFDAARQAPVLGLGYMASQRVPMSIELDHEEGEDTVVITSWGENFHSQPVETLVDLGIPGLVLFFALIVSLVRRFRRLAKSAVDPGVAPLAAALAGTTFVMVIDSFFHNWLLTPGSPYSLLYWCLIGIGLRLERIDRDAAAAVGALARTPRAIRAGATA